MKILMWSVHGVRKIDTSETTSIKLQKKSRTFEHGEYCIADPCPQSTPPTHQDNLQVRGKMAKKISASGKAGRGGGEGQHHTRNTHTPIDFPGFQFPVWPQTLFKKNYTHTGNTHTHTHRRPRADHNFALAIWFDLKRPTNMTWIRNFLQNLEWSNKNKKSAIQSSFGTTFGLDFF